MDDKSAGLGAAAADGAPRNNEIGTGRRDRRPIDLVGANCEPSIETGTDTHKRGTVTAFTNPDLKSVIGAQSLECRRRWQRPICRDSTAVGVGIRKERRLDAP